MPCKLRNWAMKEETSNKLFIAMCGLIIAVVAVGLVETCIDQQHELKNLTQISIAAKTREAGLQQQVDLLTSQTHYLAQISTATKARLDDLQQQVDTLASQVSDLQDLVDELEFPARASWYGPGFQGKLTASGEVYDPWGLTMASKTLPLNKFYRIRNPKNQRVVILRVNDRGPYTKGRDLDLSQEAARELGLTGVELVMITRVGG